MKFTPHHTAISVRNLEKTLEFYKKIGFEQVHRYDDPDKVGVKIKLDNYFLEIFAYNTNHNTQPLSDSLGGSLETIGIKHIAFHTEDIEEALKEMKLQGLVNEDALILKKGDELGEARFFFIQDPDGIWIEFINDPRYS
jgi:catechol 2,3-dioxygenase-like lactoylglutathione lyase family enzyme